MESSRRSLRVIALMEFQAETTGQRIKAGRLALARALNQVKSARNSLSGCGDPKRTMPPATSHAKATKEAGITMIAFNRPLRERRYSCAAVSQWRTDSMRLFFPAASTSRT